MKSKLSLEWLEVYYHYYYYYYYCYYYYYYYDIVPPLQKDKCWCVSYSHTCRCKCSLTCASTINTQHSYTQRRDTRFYTSIQHNIA